ncbi:MAG: BatD family protein [Planctomycetota bacterium]
MRSNTTTQMINEVTTNLTNKQRSQTRATNIADVRAAVRVAVSFCIVALLIGGSVSRLAAQNISIRISSKTAYVDAPLTMFVTIDDYGDYRLPKLPSIDDCKFELTGQPNHTTRVSQFNNRIWRSQSVKLQYELTPSRPGTYSIPELVFVVDGRELASEPFEFEAIVSEVGDLMFAELECEQRTVYVGQPVEVTLNVWIKPFRSEQDIVVTGRNLFGQVNIDSESGYFQWPSRVSGTSGITAERTFLSDENGENVEYILFRYPAQFYPERPGPIGLGDVTVRCEYPTSVGLSRDPFADMLGTRSRRRYVIRSTRPISLPAEPAAVDALPLPTEGQPSSFRGAIGRYKITTRTQIDSVNAGDPIELQIGIIGDGKMDSIQAPMLSEIPELARDFIVSERALPGFARDGEKFFMTSIRPRRAGIEEVPAIPFTFFNPETGSYEITTSDPVPITVNESKVFSLSSLGARTRPSEQPDEIEKPESDSLDYQNNLDPAAIISAPRTSSSVRTQGWWYAIVIPPLLWLFSLTCYGAVLVGRVLGSWRPAKTIAAEQIRIAAAPAKLIAALEQFVATRLKLDDGNGLSAVGALRQAGVGHEADQLESLLQSLTNTTSDTLAAPKKQALEMLDMVDLAITRAADRRITNRWGKSGQGVVASILLATIFVAPADAQTQPAGQSLTLDETQVEQLFVEANQLYQEAMASDSLEAIEWFSEASIKYQQLIDSGIRSAPLYLNLANALAQTGSLPESILNYERCLDIDPGNSQARKNLALLRASIESESDSATQTRANILNNAADLITQTIGRQLSGWLCAMGSVLCWGWLTLFTFKRQVGRYWSVGLIGATLFLFFGAVILLNLQSQMHNPAVVMIEGVELRSSDDLSAAPIVHEPLELGSMVDVSNQRSNWVEIQLASGQSGWVPLGDVAVVRD